VTVVVTGAAGVLGSHVLRAVRAAGHEARGIDAVTPAQAQPQASSFVRADLTDLGAAIEALADADAVVHAAAIPRPTGRTSSDVFETNVLAAYNVVEAASLHGVTRLVNASSFSVLGWPFNPMPIVPLYLPIDEQHPLAPQEAYGLSKQLTEEIVAAATRRAPALSAISLRMPWLQTAATFARDVAPRREQRGVANANLWSYLDAEDAAQAFVAALEAPVEGHAAVYLSAPDTFMETETLTLVHAAFGDVELRRPLPGHAPLLDTRAAEQLLGIRARRSWRDYGAQA
jgi:nucleoside-diphosphate-sugar epimerase